MREVSSKYFVKCICQKEIFADFLVFGGLCSKYCQLTFNSATKAEWTEYWVNEKKYNQLQKEHLARIKKTKKCQFEMLKRAEWNLETKAKLRALITTEWLKSSFADSDWKLVNEIKNWINAQPKIRKAREKKKLSVVVQTVQKQKRRFRHWYLFVGGQEIKKVFEDGGLNYEQAKEKLLADFKFSGRYEYVWTAEKEQKETNRFW